MKKVTLKIPEYVYRFYKQIGDSAGGLSPEKVMADSLFKLAGELSLQAMNTKHQNSL